MQVRVSELIFVIPSEIEESLLKWRLLVILIKFEEKIIRHSGYIMFQTAEAVIIVEILSRIERLRCYSVYTITFYYDSMDTCLSNGIFQRLSSIYTVKLNNQYTENPCKRTLKR